MPTQDQIEGLLDAALRRDWQRARAIALQIAAHERGKNPASRVADRLARLVDDVERRGMGDEAKALQMLMPQGRDDAGGLVERRPARRTLADVDMPAAAGDLFAGILAEHRDAATLEAAGFQPINRVMLVGPPGCGKTAAAEALARELDRPFVVARLDAVVGSHLGETARAMRQIFEFIAKAPPLVVLLDEFDAIAAKRAGHRDSASQEMSRAVNAILSMLDTYDGPTILMATSNRDDIIDDAIWRRFDEALYFPRPDDAALWRYVRRQVAAVAGLAPEAIDPHEAWLTEAMSGLSYAEAERVIRRAAKRTVLTGASLADAFANAFVAERHRERQGVA
jgi:hypothetical protein